MTTIPWTLERRVHFRQGGRGRGKEVHEAPPPDPAPGAGAARQQVDGAGVAPGRPDAVRSRIQLRGTGPAGPRDPGADMSDHEPDLLGARSPGGAAVLAANARGAGSDHPRRFAAHRGATGLAEAAAALDPMDPRGPEAVGEPAGEAGKLPGNPRLNPRAESAWATPTLAHVATDWRVGPLESPTSPNGIKDGFVERPFLRGSPYHQFFRPRRGSLFSVDADSQLIRSLAPLTSRGGRSGCRRPQC